MICSDVHALVLALGFHQGQKCSRSRCPEPKMLQKPHSDGWDRCFYFVLFCFSKTYKYFRALKDYLTMETLVIF